MKRTCYAQFYKGTILNIYLSSPCPPCFHTVHQRIFFYLHVQSQEPVLHITVYKPLEEGHSELRSFVFLSHDVKEPSSPRVGWTSAWLLAAVNEFLVFFCLLAWLLLYLLSCLCLNSWFFSLLHFRCSPPSHWERLSKWQGKIFLPDGVIAWHGVIWLQCQGGVYVPHITDCATIKNPGDTHYMSFLVELSADTVFLFF